MPSIDMGRRLGRGAGVGLPLPQLRDSLPIAGLALAIALLSVQDLGAQQTPTTQPGGTPATPSLPGSAPLPQLPSAFPGSLTVQPAFFVVIDAAHGGADPGARMANNALEKELTLALSMRLGSTLAARGMAVVATRNSDRDLSAKTRAGIANHALAAACLMIHATATGSGVHLFTSSLAPATASTPFPMVPWQTAQAAWITRSLRLASEINLALGQAEIPVTLGRASVQPLDNLTCPAVAIEVAPLVASAANKSADISDLNYQQRILDALAAAVLEWSTEWRQQP